MAKGDDIQEPLVKFAVAVMDLCDKFPNTPAGTHCEFRILNSQFDFVPRGGTKSRG
jgi:hypothetical protein